MKGHLILFRATMSRVFNANPSPESTAQEVLSSVRFKLNRRFTNRVSSGDYRGSLR